MDISLITSLYQAQKHLPAYIRYAQSVAKEVNRAGLSLEIILIANDATPPEQELLESLARTMNAARTANLRLINVNRENIARSWNRGIQAATARYFGFWNVDDKRTAEALIAGFQQLQKGSNLVDFPYDLVIKRKRLGLFETEHRRRLPNHFNHETLTPRIVLGTFFMTSKELIEEIGFFDENFRVAQDFEWTARAMGKARYQIVDVYAGDFIVHGNNLSNIGRPIEIVESNIVLMRHAIWQHVRPTADPDLMRNSWETWGNPGIVVPPEIEDMLWGERALEHFRKWSRNYRRQLLTEKARRPPRYLINRSGLRPYLAKLGIVKPET